MKLKQYYAAIALYAMPLMLVLPAHASGTVNNEAEVRQVIEQMNHFVSERKLPELLTLFAEDSIKVDLFPMHKYGADATKDSKVKSITLEQRWQTIAPILFATTKFYRRSVKDMDINVNKGLAVAWLEIETESLSLKPGATSKRHRFKEICILRQYHDGWRIVVLSNNRHSILAE